MYIICIPSRYIAKHGFDIGLDIKVVIGITIIIIIIISNGNKNSRVVVDLGILSFPTARRRWIRWCIGRSRDSCGNLPWICRFLAQEFWHAKAKSLLEFSGLAQVFLTYLFWKQKLWEWRYVWRDMYPCTCKSCWLLFWLGVLTCLSAGGLRWRTSLSWVHHHLPARIRPMTSHIPMVTSGIETDCKTGTSRHISWYQRVVLPRLLLRVWWRIPVMSSVWKTESGKFVEGDAKHLHLDPVATNYEPPGLIWCDMRMQYAHGEAWSCKDFFWRKTNKSACFGPRWSGKNWQILQLTQIYMNKNHRLYFSYAKSQPPRTQKTWLKNLHVLLLMVQNSGQSGEGFFPGCLADDWTILLGLR